MSKELLAQALEFLEDNQHLVADNERHAYVMEYNSFIEQLKEALAKQEQGEPVAFKIYLPKTPRQDVNHGLLPWVYDQDPSSGNVASMWVTPVKNTPPQRTWVGLTEQEQGAIMESLNAYGTNLYHFANAIEAKLKEKNT